jgi:uncharacterized protein
MPDYTVQLPRLFELQQVDAAIDSRLGFLHGLDDGSGADSRAAAEHTRLDELAAAHKALEAALRDRELRLKGAEEERAAKHKQAYGGSVHDPRQLAALEKKLEELGRLKSKLEDESLGLMDEIEASAAALGKQQKLVQDLEQKSGATHQSHDSETKRLKHELRDLKARREALVAELDPQLLASYDSIAQKTGSTAVAAVKWGSCTGCKTTIPSTYAPRLRAVDQVVRCENCRRILYLPPGESPFRREDE